MCTEVISKNYWEQQYCLKTFLNRSTLCILLFTEWSQKIYCVKRYSLKLVCTEVLSKNYCVQKYSLKSTVSRLVSRDLFRKLYDQSLHN